MPSVSRLRRALGLTQSELAGLVDVHPMTVSKWERGLASPRPFQTELLGAFGRALRRGERAVVSGKDRPGGTALLARLLGAAFTRMMEEVSMELSASNCLLGKVIAIKEGVVTTQVVMEIAPGVRITSVITADSARRLGLKPGKKVCAIIKATEVIVGVP